MHVTRNILGCLLTIAAYARFSPSSLLASEYWSWQLRQSAISSHLEHHIPVNHDNLNSEGNALHRRCRDAEMSTGNNRRKAVEKLHAVAHQKVSRLVRARHALALHS